MSSLIPSKLNSNPSLVGIDLRVCPFAFSWFLTRVSRKNVNSLERR